MNRSVFSPEYYFYSKDGTELKSLEDLHVFFDKMHDHVYHHHVNSEKNDFSHWIKDVFNMPELSEKIAGANNKAEAAKIIRSYLKKNSTGKKAKSYFVEANSKTDLATPHPPFHTPTNDSLVEIAFAYVKSSSDFWVGISSGVAIGYFVSLIIRLA